MSDDGAIPQWFWDLLASAERSLRSLCHQLEQLPRERLLQFQTAFDEAKDSLNPYSDWVEAAPHISEWPSEDGADDFSAWVVIQGKEFYHRVRANPDEIQHYLDLFNDVEAGRHPSMHWDIEVDREEYRGYQRADYIITPIYRTRFGQSA